MNGLFEYKTLIIDFLSPLNLFKTVHKNYIFCFKNVIANFYISLIAEMGFHPQLLEHFF